MMNRRDFCMVFLAAPAIAISSNLAWAAAAESAEGAATERSFPVGNYTPYGYLDNPFHTWNLHRSGILRSVPPIGFGFYFPAGPGGYFDFAKNGVYEAHLRLGFYIGEHRFWQSEDFRPDQLVSSYHSKNIFTYAFAEQGTNLECTFLQVGENVLAVKITAQSAKPQSIRLLAVLMHKLGGAEWWGRDGLIGEYDAASDAVRMRPFAAGKVFTILSDKPSETHFLAGDETELTSWFNATSALAATVEKRTAYYPKALWGALQFKLDVVPGRKTEQVIMLARGENAALCDQQARQAMRGTPEQFLTKLAEDAAFWVAAPRLEGDWPKHWKNGWVYDFETLRIMVRRPIGIYKYPWDAMQIQAPRTVLAETSIDMWALSYADPEMAKKVLLGLYLNAAADNVPCSREDGEMNMVAVDGSECGTSLSWCYPFFCARSLWLRTRDHQWLAEIYPRLARLLRWTLKNRTDSEEFVTGKCSWETGMDAASRFLIQQPTGGEIIAFLRIVELQAATAQAAEILAEFADLLRDTASAGEWKKIHELYAAKTQTLWNGDWFYDFDTRNGQLVTTVAKDVAQVAPIFCRIANEQQIAKMRPVLHQFFMESGTRRLPPADDWQDELHWSSLVLPYLESLHVAGEMELLSQVVQGIAERVYAGTDRRSLASVSATRGSANPAGNAGQKLGWPGVSCEIWGSDGAYGGEGYGWGAVLPAHIIRNLVGFRDPATSDQLPLAPNLPQSFMAAGKIYRVLNLHCLGDTLELGIRVLDGQRVRLEGAWTGSLRTISVTDAAGTNVPLQRTGRAWQFEGFNRRHYLARVTQASGL